MSEEEVLERAEAAGVSHAEEQLRGNYFQDWLREQMREAERMRQEDPGSVLPLELPDDFTKLAKNMLQQLEWDTKRQMDGSAIRELVGDSEGASGRSVSKAFFEGFWGMLRAPTTRQWLADEIETIHREMQGGGREVGETRRTHRVADFDSLRAAIEHAQQEGATHVIVNTVGQAWLYFPIDGGKYAEAQVRKERGYWHVDGPSDRKVVDRHPRTMKIEDYLAKGAHHGVGEARRESSPMDANAFIELLSSLQPADRRTSVRFQPSLGGARGGGSVYVNFVNLPVGKGEAGAESENNRASFWIEGFEHDPAAPVAKVKVDQSNNLFNRKVPFRAKTGSPDVVARYLAAYLAKIVETVPPNFTHTRVGEARRRPPTTDHHRYTDEQVRDMLKNASLWNEQLRVAAKERGLQVSSVTPISEILSFLRGKLMVGETRRRSTHR